MAQKRPTGFAPPPDPNVLYRVRDRHEVNAPGYVWGEDLPFDEAQRLKEKIAALGKSKTVRYEPMSEPYPPVGASTPVHAVAPAPKPKAHAPSAPVRPPQPRRVVVPAPQPPVPSPTSRLTPEQQAKLDRLRGERQADPRLEQVRLTALGAASGAAQAAQARHEQQVAQNKTADAAKAAAEAVTEGGLTDEDFQAIVGDLDGEPTPEEIAAAQAEFDAQEAAGKEDSP